MSAASKKSSVPVGTCGICANNYTAMIRKKVVCKFCQKDACSKCIEQYLMSRHEDAHCLHCRVTYNDDTLYHICTKTYIQQTYFRHRQEVLINRERANLPGLQDAAMEERKRRKSLLKIAKIQKEVEELKAQRDLLMKKYIIAHDTYYKLRTSNMSYKQEEKIVKEIKEYDDLLAATIHARKDDMRAIRYDMRVNAHEDDVEEKKEDEKRKFIRRCVNDGCQGFLSTAWKCGICEFYSCSKCFIVKGPDAETPHECKKEDVDTADLIKKDSKPCPKCGEFIMKTSGCDQMFCISCKTPWSWTTGKIVISGALHNPHYYEWLQKTGGSIPRNPADVPCGGYPNLWGISDTLRNLSIPIRSQFMEFHRICMDLQERSTREYRSHIDNTGSNAINIRFLLNDVDEKKWGRYLAINEKKRKRDAEIQEIFGAFRMVAVELLNRVEYYSDPKRPYLIFRRLPVEEAEAYIVDINRQFMELIRMINDAFNKMSISYSYRVPYIETIYSKVDHMSWFRITQQKFTKAGKAVMVREDEESDDESVKSEPLTPEEQLMIAASLRE